MNDHYQVEIPNDKAATYKLVTFIIALINVIAFIYLYFNEPNKSNRNFAGLGCILSITALIFYCGKRYTIHLQTFRIEIAFFALAFTWFICGQSLFFGLMLLIAIVGVYANKKPVIHFTTTGISYPSFPPKTFNWEAVDFVRLKDGILTMELKDNRVFQFTLLKKEYEILDENAFNEFCKKETAKALSR